MLRVVCVGLVAAAALAWAAPNGRVVRIERDRGLAAVPRLCDLQPIAKEGLCVGQTTGGDRVALIDADRGIAIGEFRIDGPGAVADLYACDSSSPLVYKVKGAVTNGDPDVIANAGHVMGVRNLPFDPRMRVIKDQYAPGTELRADLALDLDGDSRIDYMLVRYSCDSAGNAVPTSDRRWCFDTYLQRNGKLTKVHTDNIQICF